MYSCYFMAQMLVPDVFSVVSKNTEMLVLLVAYLAVAACFPPILMRQETTGTQIVSRSLLTVLVHFFVCAGLYAFAQIWMGSGVWFLTLWGSFAALLTAERLFLRTLVKNLWRKRTYSRPVVLVGTFPALHALYAFMSRPKSGFWVKGVFTNDEQAQLPEGLQKLGQISDIMGYMASGNDVQAIYCQPASMSQPQNAELFDFCIQNKVSYYGIPEFLHAQQCRMEIEDMDGTPLIVPIAEPLSHWPNRWIKRVIDFVLSALFLATLFPFIYLVVAFFIKRQSPGPVFRKKTFEGRNGKKCRGLYFRTTGTDAEGQEKMLPVGKALQSRHWDELPLFFKILCGDLSLVGPRYHTNEDMETYHQQTDKHQICRLVKPGLSGCAHTKAIGDTIQNDIAYVQNWSLWLDLKLILRMAGKAFCKHECVNTPQENVTNTNPEVETAQTGSPTTEETNI